MVAVAGLTLLVAACGSGPTSPGVASEGKSPPTTAAASAGSAGGVPKDFMQKLLSYAECMRAHGISDFPDPTAGPGGQGGGFSIKAGRAVTWTLTTRRTRLPTKPASPGYPTGECNRRRRLRN